MVIASAGGFSTSSNLKISHTVGETVTATGTASTVTATQGFQQPGRTGVGIEEFNHSLSINVYPSITSKTLTLQLESNAKVHVGVYDMLGKPAHIEALGVPIEGGTHTLDISSLVAGQYLVSFSNNHGWLGTARIVKVD